jgi:hypothetical protein
MQAAKVSSSPGGRGWLQSAVIDVGVVAFGEAEARETVNPRFGQIAKVSSSKAACGVPKLDV